MLRDKITDLIDDWREVFWDRVTLLLATVFFYWNWNWFVSPLSSNLEIGYLHALGLIVTCTQTYAAINNLLLNNKINALKLCLFQLVAVVLHFVM